METVQDTFSLFVPMELIKGEHTGKTGKKSNMKFKGIASNPKTGEDLDGEILDVNGFDYSLLLKSGHINWNHQAQKDPMAIVGEPTAAMVKNNEFHIEGMLYSESELANKIYKAAEMLEKSGSTRKFGFSIEGMPIERDAKNKKHIKKAKILNIAICPTPKNAGTEMQLVKGLEFDTLLNSNYLIDQVCGDDRVIIDKSFNISIIKSSDTIIEDSIFQKSVVEISDAISKGYIVSGLDEIKRRISSFRQALNCTVWVG